MSDQPKTLSEVTTNAVEKEAQTSDFEARVAIIVRAVLAIAAFSTLAVLVALGESDKIPEYFIGIAGIAIGFFFGGASPFKK